MRLKMISHRDALAFVQVRFGSDGLNRLLATLSEEDRRIATVDTKLINNWLDVDVHNRLLAAVVELNGGREQVLWSLGEHLATEQLRGVYRVFLLVVSPDFMLRRSAQIFRTFYDGGSMEAVTLAPGRVECTFGGFHAKDRLLELSIAGWIKGATALTTAQNNRVQITTSVAEGQGLFRVLSTYTP